jgi:NADPH-dependent ferric siderophore reductase
MTNAPSEAVRAKLDDPFAQLSGNLAGTRRLQLEVTGARQLTPHMRRLELTAPELEGFSYAPGQDVMLLVAAEGNRPVRRRYTIRRLDFARRLLTLDVVLHGDGPGERWIRAAAPGDRIEGIGPRGKITTSPAADWHLFMGDESALPAIFAMTESLPGDSVATVVIEVPDPADEQELSAPARTRLTWLHRLSGRAGEAGALTAEAAEVELPPGKGHAYLLGEAKVVLALRELLAGRGLPPEQMSPKAYWGRGRANAGHGEPPRDAPASASA